MSATATPANVATEGALKPANGLLPILAAALLSTVIALGSVGAAGWWLVQHGRLASAQGVGNGAAQKPDKAAEAPPSQVLALEPMVVNLSDPDGHAYLRSAMSLRLADAADDKKDKKEKAEAGKPDKAAAARMAALRDTTLTVLAAQQSGALLAPGGVDTLKKKLRESYAVRNPDVQVLDVYLTDFLVQRG